MSGCVPFVSFFFSFLESKTTVKLKFHPSYWDQNGMDGDRTGRELILLSGLSGYLVFCQFHGCSIVTNSTDSTWNPFFIVCIFGLTNFLSIDNYDEWKRERNMNRGEGIKFPLLEIFYSISILRISKFLFGRTKLNYQQLKINLKLLNINLLIRD